MQIYPNLTNKFLLTLFSLLNNSVTSNPCAHFGQKGQNHICIQMNHRQISPIYLKAGKGERNCESNKDFSLFGDALAQEKRR